MEDPIQNLSTDPVVTRPIIVDPTFSKSSTSSNMFVTELSPTMTITLALLLSAFLYFISKPNKQKGYKPLPGPKGVPLFGNMFDLPKSRPWVKMEEWTRQYGPIYKLKLGRREMIVLGRADVALALLDKRSAIYSSRPRMIMTGELVSRNLRMTFMPYGDLWRRQRKLLHQLTSPKAASSYEPIQEQESAQIVRDMIKTPKNYWGHCQRYAGSTIMQVGFNKRAATPNHHAITEMRAVNEEMTKTAVAGRYIVDSLPFLNYLPKPLAPWKQEADALFDKTLTLFSKYFNEVRDNVANGDDTHCFTKEILRQQSSYGLKDEEAIFLAGAMFGAGSDTTSDGISTFLLTMVAHPHVLKRAQEELDTVVGQTRMPDFTDQSDLIYCNAIVKEVLRWRTIIAGGLAHSTTEDDVFEGYFIPKGTTVLANHWSIHLDPELYPEPTKFNPDRFIDSNGQLNDLKHFAFGFGRRICPGMHIAERSLFIVFSRLMWACNITNAKDEQGQIIPIDVDRFSEGFSSHPVGFQCDIKSRGPWVDEVVELATAGM
ncbi:hypothetical protein OIO90_006091 [Microbotryomycetes sp. JL221]|nr:hypothetical protein OIO90_006091 [Microbotryomycetes sp. JL221]